MFTVTSESKQYLTYILKDESADSVVEVVPERGGIITQWWIKGQEIFYLDRERFTHPDLSVRGGIPILFPICGPIPNDTFTHNNLDYPLKRHGFARDLAWQTIDQSSDAAASLTIQLNSSTETLKAYPFAFQLTFKYSLVGSKLTLEQTHTNQSSEPMPFSSGLHPYFYVQDKTQLRCEIPASQFTNHLTEQDEAFTGSFDFSQAEIDVAFKQLTARSAAVTDVGTGKTLTVTYDDHYSTLVFWTQKGKDFYCIEPWTAPRKALVTGEHLLKVDPGASLTTQVSFTLSEH